MVQQLSTNTFGTAKWIVSPTASDGTHTTIAAALTSASSGDTIFIRPGTYTENITLKVGVNLTAYTCDAFTPNVTIIGKCSYSAAGTVSISGIRFQTNSDFILEVTGSSASVVIMNNCYLNCTNNTGVSFTSSSASSNIQFINCTFFTTTTGIAYFAASTAGSLRFAEGQYGNPGGSTTTSTFASSGFLSIEYAQNFNSPISLSGTAGVNFSYSRINGASTNTTGFTTTSSSTNQSALFCRFDGGTSPAISVGAGTFMMDFCDVGSSNTNAITGAGTIRYGHIVFSGTSSTINTTTQTPLTERSGISISSQQPAFLASHTAAQTDVTGAGTTVTVNYTTEIFDQNANYDGTNTFTAPITGRYQFQASIYCNDAATSTNGGINFLTSNRQYNGSSDTPWTTSTLNQYLLNGVILADMDAGDTCVVRFTAAGMAGDTADLPANAASTFSGYLVC